MLQYISIGLVLLGSLLQSNIALAESLAAPAYITMGSGLLLLLGLAVYVIKQMRFLIRQHSKKPAQ